MVYDYKLHLVIRTPRACPWEQSDAFLVCYVLFHDFEGDAADSGNEFTPCPKGRETRLHVWELCPDDVGASPLQGTDEIVYPKAGIYIH